MPNWMDSSRWLAKLTATYAALDAAFATTWGARSGGYFQIPNLNGDGRYLRGGTAGTLQAQATAKNGLTATSSSIPTATQSHTHAASGTAGYMRSTGGASQWARTAVDTLAGFAESAASVTVTVTGASTDHGHTAPTLAVASSDTETRPITAVITYCIKY